VRNHQWGVFFGDDYGESHQPCGESHLGNQGVLDLFLFIFGCLVTVGGRGYWYPINIIP